MNWKAFLAWAKQMADTHPQHRRDIADIAALARDEIDGGGSESHEIECVMDDIKELVEE